MVEIFFPNYPGDITNMAVVPIMVKSFKKSSSLDP